MTLRDLTDTAATLARHGLNPPAAVAHHGCSETALFNPIRYLTHRWQLASRRTGTEPDDLRRRQQLGEEMLVAHLLCRVALAVRVIAHGEHHDRCLTEAMAALTEQSEVCTLHMALLEHLPEGLGPFLAWQRLRRRLAHWSDVLISQGWRHSCIRDFACDHARAASLAADGPHDAVTALLWETGLRQAVPSRPIADPLHAALLRAIVGESLKGLVPRSQPMVRTAAVIRRATGERFSLEN